MVNSLDLFEYHTSQGFEYLCDDRRLYSKITKIIMQLAKIKLARNKWDANRARI